MTPRFYITTPIYYVNASPHLGHAYTTLVADVLTRYHRLRGYDAWFLTGTDEHGDKIVQAAQAHGVDPQTYADRISAEFRNTWPPLGIENDDFIRTTEDRHKRTVARILADVYEKGDIYFGKYGGHYCFGCERFYTDTEMVDGMCPDHQKPLTYIEEENYFFRMSKYQDWLIDHIHKNPDFIRPERYRNEVLSFLKAPLEDLCISRPKTRLTWGITLPFDDRFVTYVWFDALINYLSALDYPDGQGYRDRWPAAWHLVAKDILKPHAIYWPTMLKAAGIEPYRHLNVHGYWRLGEKKMGKSVGNVVQALALKDVYGLDAFRYFLMRDMVFGLDSDFSEEALVGRINADLANDLGNLTQRSLTMVKKFGGGRAPLAARTRTEGGELREAGLRVVREYTLAFESLGFHKALIAVWDLISQANRFVDHRAPWVLAKDPAKKDELDGVLYELMETLVLVAGLIEPVMPKTAGEMRRQVGLDPSFSSIHVADIEKALAPGLALQPGPSLFPRVELGGAAAERKPKMEKTTAPASAAEASPKTGMETAASPAPFPPAPAVPASEPAPAAADRPAVPPLAADLITFDEFKKLDLRVATILEAVRVPKSDKLLKLTVEVDGPRTIVAGMGKHFTPEEMVGRQVIVVANLTPAKLMGVTSQGMVLAATDGAGLALLTPSRPAQTGAKVS